MRFENGRPITSRDVKYGIERSFASEVIVGGPTYVVDLLDDPGNPYAGPYQDESDGQARACRRSQTPDDRTIVFKLRAPQPDLPFVMALPSSSPVPIEADTGAGYGADPVSSGPYAITSVDPATGILLDRNPQWDPATDDVRTALPDQVVVRTGLSGVERDQALLAGSADLDISGTGVQAATTSRLAEDDGRPGARPGRRRHHRRRSGCSPCRPTSRRWTTPTAGRRSPRSSTAGPCRTRSAAPVNAVRSSQLWPRGLAGGPEDPDPRPDLDAARARARRRAASPTGSAPCSPSPTRRASVDVGHRRSPSELAEVGITAEVRPLDAGDVLRHGRRQPGQRHGERVRHRAGHLDGGLPDRRRRSWCRWSTAAASATVGNTNYARLERPGGQHADRPGPGGGRPGGAPTPGARCAAAVGAGRRPTCRWPRPACSCSPASGCATAW